MNYLLRIKKYLQGFRAKSASLKKLEHYLRKRWVQKILILLGLAVAFFVFMNYAALPWYVKHGGTFFVPNVTGLPIAQAREVLIRAELQPMEGDTRADPNQPVGTVVFQNPPAQSVVKKGRRVYVTTSVGEVLVVVPQLRGHSLRDASFALERYGLKLGGIAYETSDQYPENTIVAQSMGADMKIPKGTRVGVVVSSGPKGTGAVVPNTVGRTLTEAERLLQGAGLNVGNVTYQLSYELIPNTVVEQFPRAGETAFAGQKIDLFVVKVGKPTEEIKVPKH